MGIIVAVLVVALVLAVVGLLAEGLLWLLGVALALVIGVGVIRWAQGTRA